MSLYFLFFWHNVIIVPIYLFPHKIHIYWCFVYIIIIPKRKMCITRLHILIFLLHCPQYHFDKETWRSHYHIDLPTHSKLSSGQVDGTWHMLTSKLRSIVWFLWPVRFNDTYTCSYYCQYLHSVKYPHDTLTADSLWYEIVYKHPLELVVVIIDCGWQTEKASIHIQ